MARGRLFDGYLQSHSDATSASLRKQLNDVSHEHNRAASWALLVLTGGRLSRSLARSGRRTGTCTCDIAFVQLEAAERTESLRGDYDELDWIGTLGSASENLSSDRIPPL